MPVVRELSKVGKGQSFFFQTEDYGGVFKDVLFSHPLGEMTNIFEMGCNHQAE